MKGRLPLILWATLVSACPTTLMVIGARYNRLSDRSIETPGWVPSVVNGLFVAHLIFSIIACVAVAWVFSERRSRWLAWSLTAALLPLSFSIWIGTCMSISGSVL